MLWYMGSIGFIRPKRIMISAWSIEWSIDWQGKDHCMVKRWSMDYQVMVNGRSRDGQWMAKRWSMNGQEIVN